MTEREGARLAARRLAILQHAEEVTGNVALTCRYYGIGRQLFYVWKRRLEQEGIHRLRDRSRRPHQSPKATRTEVVGKIIYLRQHYHFGPAKISMCLSRYYDIDVSSSGVWQILKRLDMNRLPASQRYKPHKERWKRYEKQQPGHRVQVDVKFHQSAAKVEEEALPVHSDRRLHPDQGASGYTIVLNQATAIRFLDYVLEKLPFKVDAIQTDNGAEFQSAFHWHVLDRGIANTCIRAGRRGSTARSSARTASTPRSSTGSSAGW